MWIPVQSIPNISSWNASASHRKWNVHNSKRTNDLRHQLEVHENIYVLIMSNYWGRCGSILALSLTNLFLSYSYKLGIYNSNSFFSQLVWWHLLQGRHEASPSCFFLSLHISLCFIRLRLPVSKTNVHKLSWSFSLSLFLFCRAPSLQVWINSMCETGLLFMMVIL